MLEHEGLGRNPKWNGSERLATLSRLYSSAVLTMMMKSAAIFFPPNDDQERGYAPNDDQERIRWSLSPETRPLLMPSATRNVSRVRGGFSLVG